ncbi:MAG TPA: hypothetical protein IAB27_06155 [Candidatus Coprosoma intestinipullorum]|uniref:Uncharacterized protein n=1 Tax=Candidatus Coprosoma intestinipullorum TaxID=2840752 RepID=A0A9D1D087_9FIRM|nr:hypothetical protein [Candidatus Coprosoma intestinipullorum]
MSKIILISGKARAGKDTTALLLGKIYEEEGKKIVNLAYGNYIKEYAKKISNWDGRDETKPRSLLQRLGTDIIRNKIDPNFFVKRLCDDIEVYSYFFDVITVSDARFPNELDTPCEMFEDVIKIKIVRDNFQSNLTDTEKKHITETALDNYDDFDYIIHNDGTISDLREKILKLVKELNV